MVDYYDRQKLHDPSNNTSNTDSPVSLFSARPTAETVRFPSRNTDPKSEGALFSQEFWQWSCVTVLHSQYAIWRFSRDEMKSTGSAQVDYWTTAREPWPSLLFILPFLVVYEVGAFSQSHLPASRNGADLWIRQFGMESGVFIEWIFPLLAPLFLLIWQLVGRRPWKWNLETLSGMFAESLMFAMLLVTVGQVIAFAFPMQILLDVSPVNFSRVVSFLGAGIYEEMLFRLTLLPVTFSLLRVLLVPSRIAVIGSILFSSWLFATAHYVGSASLLAPDELYKAMQTVCQSQELWFSYAFRFIAGLLFSALFWYRGFGIAVGCHILYDVIVGVLLSGIG